MSPDLVSAVHRLAIEAGAVDIRRLVLAEAPLLDEESIVAVAAAVRARMSGLGALESLLTDPSVTEIMVNGGPVWVERAGAIERVLPDMAPDDVHVLIERVLSPLGLRIDRTVPFVDARLPDGSRVNAVIPPLALDGPCLTVRRFRPVPVTLDDLAAPDVGALLADAVGARRTIVVSGGTGAGKTTLLNALAGCIPPGERIITIEDAAELRLPLEHVVRLEARPANAEGAGEVRVRDLVRNVLRMRPDRIIVGEVRGAEALDMLQAMNTGHEGSLSTCHANGTVDALRRIETMVLGAGSGLPLDAVREQVSSALDLVVHVARRSGGARRVVAVDEVLPVDAPARTRTLAREDGVQ